MAAAGHGRGHASEDERGAGSGRRPPWRRLRGWAPFAAGLLVGAVNGLLGVGGGTLLVPALVFWFRLPDHQAHGTAILTVGLTSVVSAWVYAGRGLVDWSLAAQVAAGGVVGALAGARLMRSLRPRTLRQMYGIFLVLLGLRMLWA